MPKSDTLQIRLDPTDMQCLHDASSAAGMPLSAFVRHQLEPVIIMEKIARIAQDFGYITRATLFGSMARGDHGADSDIDIAIETDGPYKWMGDKGMGRFVARIQEATGREVDVVKAKYCSSDLANEIAKEGRLAYER